MAKAADRSDEQIIAALLSNPTVRKAATACGVSEAKIYSRLRDPDFKEKYDRTRYELLIQCAGYLQGITGDALQKMYSIMIDRDTPPQTQLNAAKAIADNNLKLTEQVDVLSQLAELRKAVFPDE